MLYSEIIAVCSQIHTKHINTLCGQKVEYFNVKRVVHIVTTGFQSLNCSQPLTVVQSAGTARVSAGSALSHRPFLLAGTPTRPLCPSCSELPHI
jgi:hypothetical protein